MEVYIRRRTEQLKIEEQNNQEKGREEQKLKQIVIEAKRPNKNFIDAISENQSKNPKSNAGTQSQNSSYTEEERMQKKAKQLIVILKDINQQLSRKNQPKLDNQLDDQGKSKNLLQIARSEEVWCKALSETNSLFYHMSLEGKILVKQVAIQILARPNHDQPLYQACLQNLITQIQEQQDQNEDLFRSFVVNLIQDLTEQFQEGLLKAIDLGYKLRLNENFTTNNQTRNSIDKTFGQEQRLSRGATNRDSSQISLQQSLIEQKCLFRQRSTISIYTDTLLQICQSVNLLPKSAVQTPKTSKDIQQGKSSGKNSHGWLFELITEKLFAQAFNGQDFGHQNSSNLLCLVSQDLVYLAGDASLEHPSSPMLYKCISLKLADLLYQACYEKSKPGNEPESISIKQLESKQILFLVSLCSLLLKGSENQNQILVKREQNRQFCYCGQAVSPQCDDRQTGSNSEIISCHKCQKQIFHPQCVNLIDQEVKDDDWLCASCEENVGTLCERIQTFYTQMQSNYCDFTQAAFFLSNMEFLLKSKDPKEDLRLDVDQSLSELHLHQTEDQNRNLASKRGLGRSWINRELTFNVVYARTLLLKLGHLFATKDLFQALKDTLICVACSDTVALVRSKALKAIGYAVKRNQNLMLDLQVQSAVLLRLNDQSMMTRESAIDLLTHFFSAVRKEPQNIPIKESASVFSKYVLALLEKTQDKGATVRKKAINCLSIILEIQELGIQKRKIMGILVSKWQDSSQKVRQNLVKSLSQLIVSTLGEPELKRSSHNQNDGESSGEEMQTKIQQAVFLIQDLTQLTQNEEKYGFEPHQRRQVIWEEIFAHQKARECIYDNATSFVSFLVSQITKDSTTSSEKLSASRVLYILAPYLKSQIISVIPLLTDSLQVCISTDPTQTFNQMVISSKIQDHICQTLVSVLQNQQSSSPQKKAVLEIDNKSNSDEEIQNELPLRTSTQLLSTSKKCLYSCPLVNIQPFCELLESLDQPALLQILIQCASILKKLNPENDRTFDQRQICRAVLVSGYGFGLLPKEGLDQVKQIMEIDVKSIVQEAFEQVVKIVCSKEEEQRSSNLSDSKETGSHSFGQEMLLDVTIEALAQIWQAQPDLLEQAFQSRVYLDLFEVLKRATLSSNQQEDSDVSQQPKMIKAQTKVHLFDTLTCMVNQMESQGVNDKMLNFLMSLVVSSDPHTPFLNSYQDSQVRLAASNLFISLHKQGQIQLSVSLSQLVALLNDPIPLLRQKALQLIKHILHSKLTYFQACITPSLFIDLTYAHFVKCEPEAQVAAFVHTRCGEDFYLEDDQPILFQILDSIACEDATFMVSFSKSLVNLADSILQQGNVEKIAFYGQILITICCSLVGNQKAIKEVQKVIEQQLQTRELVTYTTLKQQIEKENSVQLLSKTVNEAFYVLSLKYLDKLLKNVQKGQQRNSSGAVQEFDEIDQINTASSFTYHQTALRKVRKEIGKLLETGFTGQVFEEKQQIQELAQNVRQALRLEVKREDLSLKDTFKKQLDKIKQVPKVNKNKRQSQLIQMHPSDEDEIRRASLTNNLKSVTINRRQTQKVEIEEFDTP